MNRLTTLALALAAVQAVALPAFAEDTAPAATPAAAEVKAGAPDDATQVAKADAKTTKAEPKAAETKAADAKPDAKPADPKVADAAKPAADGKKADVAAAAKGKLDQDAIRKRREAGAVAAKEQNANNGAVSPGPDGSTKFVSAKPRPAPQNPG